MKHTKTTLRERNIFNSYDIARRGSAPVFIHYRPQDTGRAYLSAAWQVVGTKASVKTDPNAYWRDYHNKTFNVYGRAMKAEKLAEAMDWASKNYGVEAWERTPFGDYVAKGILASIQ